MFGKICTYFREMSLCNLVNTYCEIVILRTRNREKYKHNVIYEERCNQYERYLLEVLISLEEHIERKRNEHQEIERIAHSHQF